jgi:hypothetical protein
MRHMGHMGHNARRRPHMPREHARQEKQEDIHDGQTPGTFQHQALTIGAEAAGTVSALAVVVCDGRAGVSDTIGVPHVRRKDDDAADQDAEEAEVRYAEVERRPAAAAEEDESQEGPDCGDEGDLVLLAEGNDDEQQRGGLGCLR